MSKRRVRELTELVRGKDENKKKKVCIGKEKEVRARN